MARRPKLIAAFFAVYLFGIATPFLVQRPIAALGHSIGGREEFSRKTSPDGVLDAVIIEINPGAFSSYLYHLFLVPKGAQVDANWTDDPIVYTCEGDHLMVNWEKPHFLTVTTGDSHVQLFANLWYSKRVPDYYVELALGQAGKHYLSAKRETSRTAMIAL
jgi:hypothetical protein